VNIDQPQFDHPAFRGRRRSWAEQAVYWQEQWDELSLQYDDALILLDAVVNHFTEHHPEEWATLPLGIQTRIAAELGDLDPEEVIFEEDEVPGG
jgi:hypothetical protein